ncbi:hypothetical protein KEJ18_07120 [Candidatus Bathyarchaeota archaeon]|nr:hypothetical protein [Candidatus Bathyarchaeota archaeon]
MEYAIAMEQPTEKISELFYSVRKRLIVLCVIDTKIKQFLGSYENNGTKSCKLSVGYIVDYLKRNGYLPGNYGRDTVVNRLNHLVETGKLKGWSVRDGFVIYEH